MHTCKTMAQFGVTTGDHTENVCPGHLVALIYKLDETVMVYQIKASRKCEY